MRASLNRQVTIIGGGLAGCEAAWQLLRAGIPVLLVEQRPGHATPAHSTGRLAELVCSNSLRSDRLTSAVGLLKAEMRLLDSLVIAAAEQSRVPAGQALAVDREAFSAAIESRLLSHPLFALERRRADCIPAAGAVVVATGPLTEGPFAEHFAGLVGARYLHFYDAIAPIVAAGSIDESKGFRASRYGKGGEDYLNLPLDKGEYLALIASLRAAEQYPLRGFEDDAFFEGCLPVEEMARRGDDVLRFGPLKPVGLRDPRTGKLPYAVVQLRQDDLAAEHYNLVGFQTRMRRGEQARVLRMIPGLAEAEFARLGQMHRNTYIDAPEVLEPTFQVRGKPDLFVAGQISGVEGYVESAASGLAVGLYIARRAFEGQLEPLPPTTAIGALGRYVSRADAGHFQPTNVTFGLLDTGGLAMRPRRRQREAIAERSLEHLRRRLEAGRNRTQENLT